MRDTIRHPKLLDLYDYWASKRRGRLLPARADLDPLDIPQLLPHLALIDIEAGTGRTKFRLVGTAIVGWRHDLAHPDPTGRYIDETEVLLDANGIRWWLAENVRTKAPSYRIEDVVLARRAPSMRLYVLQLPLSADGETVNMVLCGIFSGNK
ncbi:MAG: PAS domain-containing protein [Rhodospirillales bacterium]|nr:PAS domain-containing protein [Rhodospirillales bacterium]